MNKLDDNADEGLERRLRLTEECEVLREYVFVI